MSSGSGFVLQYDKFLFFILSLKQFVKRIFEASEAFALSKFAFLFFFLKKKIVSLQASCCGLPFFRLCF